VSEPVASVDMTGYGIPDVGADGIHGVEDSHPARCGFITASGHVPRHSTSVPVLMHSLRYARVQ
jgi:hypothetical protein